MGRRRSGTGPGRPFAVDCDLIVVVMAAQPDAVHVAVGAVGAGRSAGRRRRREERRRRRRLLQAGQETVLIVAVVAVVAVRRAVVVAQAAQVVVGGAQERGQSVHHPVGFRVGVDPAEELVAQRRELVQRKIGRSA